MNDIPDLANAELGDLFESPDGRVWEVMGGGSGMTVFRDAGAYLHAGFTDTLIVDGDLNNAGFKKVEQ